MQTKSRYKTARRMLIFWTLFIGIGALAGAVTMLIDPTGKLMGMDAMLPYFKKLPFSDVLFSDFVFAGYALLIVNGITNLAAAILMFFNKRIGVVMGGIFGVTLMLWICIQFYIFPFNFMSTSYFIFGFIQALTGYAACVFLKQESFNTDIHNYPNIGKNGKNLVVFFSRMGYVRKVAFETANKTGADIYEIKSTERSEGTIGFWWCGRFGMHKWEMPIKPVLADLMRYDHVTICSPIWVFSLAAPVRAFCKQAAGKIKSADYVLVHHQKSKYENAAKEMDSLLGIKHTRFCSIMCREGRMKTLIDIKTEN